MRKGEHAMDEIVEDVNGQILLDDFDGQNILYRY